MYKRNDGLTEDHRLQNQFTAYLRSAVHNGRIDYLRGKDKPQRIEIMLEDMDYLMAEESDFLLQLAEYEALRQALQEIKEQERYILLARVIDEKGFAEIADEVGLSYKGTAAVYYRILINRISRFLMEYFRHKILQQVPDLKCYPVVGIVLIRHDIQFVIVQVPCGGKRGYA